MCFIRMRKLIHTSLIQPKYLNDIKKKSTLTSLFALLILNMIWHRTVTLHCLLQLYWYIYLITPHFVWQWPWYRLLLVYNYIDCLVQSDDLKFKLLPWRRTSLIVFLNVLMLKQASGSHKAEKMVNWHGYWYHSLCSHTNTFCLTVTVV